MRVVACLALLLVNVHLSRSCYAEGPILLCLNIPPAFTPGYSSLVMALKDVGEINSTVLRSNNLTSVTKLRIDSAGVTGIAEGAFSSFQNLTNLSLNQNLLKEINPNWFGRPEILSELSLTENQIEGLNEFMLNGLINLTRLSLNKNRIRTINPSSFSSQSVLAELDLSENRMTQVSPQVFRSLRSTRIRLDGNPWDCSCGTEDFVDFLRDLQSRSLLDRPMKVTCESPPSLSGQPMWRVTVCVTSSPSGPPSATQTVQPKHTDVLTTVPASTVVTKPLSQRTLNTEASVQPNHTDAPLIHSSYTATAPARQTPVTRTSVQPKPTDTLKTTTTPILKTETNVTSPPSLASMIEISVHSKPSDLPTYTISTPTGRTETCATSRPSLDTNIVCTLTVIIVVLCLLLFLVCFLVVLHRRKHSNKTVTPGCPKENRNEPKEGDISSGSSHAQCPGQSDDRENNRWDSEMGCRRSFTAVRAKSANAVLFTSPFCAYVRDRVTLQTETETQLKDANNQAEGKRKVGVETEVDGRIETENLTNTTDVYVKPAADGRYLDKDPHYASVSADTVPYLSICTNQNKADNFNKQSTDDPGQRSQLRKVMGRISTWPPTAIQWQVRCKMMEKEEKGSEVLTVWTSEFPCEVKKASNKEEHPSGEDKIEKKQLEDSLKINVAQMKVGHSQSSKPNDKTISFTEAQAHTDMRLEEQLQKEETAAVRQTICETQNLNPKRLDQTRDLRPKGNSAEKNTSKSKNQTEPRQAVTSRQRAENRGTSSKAPSGGASPDDETLLSGNEYAFMDLLHEVAQNNGRWTRERWRQIHANKQRL